MEVESLSMELEGSLGFGALGSRAREALSLGRRFFLAKPQTLNPKPRIPSPETPAGVLAEWGPISSADRDVAWPAVAVRVRGSGFRVYWFCEGL